MMRTYAVDQSSPRFPRIERGILAGRNKNGIIAPGILTEIIVVGRTTEIESFTEPRVIHREDRGNQHAPDLLPSNEKNGSEHCVLDIASYGLW